MPDLTYLMGLPGAGKSTLMDHLRGMVLKDLKDPLAHRIGPNGVEIGAPPNGKHGGGTDGLPIDAIEVAAAWIDDVPFERVFLEGPRLFNPRFLEAAKAAGYRVLICSLDLPWEVAAERVQQRSQGRTTPYTDGFKAGRIKMVENMEAKGWPVLHLESERRAPWVLAADVRFALNCGHGASGA